MNIRQKQLWDNLLALVNTNEAFYYQEFSLDGKRYWIFNYRLASYTDFLLSDALECRGTMFEVDQNDQPVRLAAWPQEKFFNLYENPMTMDLDLTQVVEIQEKADGSLMSTYLHNGQLRLKSKGSLFSEQALAAMKWLSRMPELAKDLLDVTALGFTVNLEWCSPEHRIVLGYTDPSLKILNMRDMSNGEYTYHWKNALLYAMHAVESVKVDDPVAFVASIPAMTDVEGYVVRLASGQRVKVKCDWYLSLHHAKDSVNNPRRLFEAILDEGIDDLRSLFHTDLVAMKMIDEMQERVDHTYNSMVKAVDAFYQDNKDLDRKDYAIKGQKDPSLVNGKLSYFGLAMNLYLGKSNDYKAYLKGRWKELGLRDTGTDE
jgi:RNA ligase